MSGAAGSSGWIDPRTLQYSGSGPAGATSDAESTVAPPVGSPIDPAETLVPASPLQAAAGSRLRSSPSPPPPRALGPARIRARPSAAPRRAIVAEVMRVP